MLLARLAVSALRRFVSPLVTVDRAAAASAGLVVVVLGAFALLRMVYAGNVEPDESDQIVFGQQLALGYSEQPPLYSWLCTGAFALFGTGVAALVAVRAVILAGTIAFLAGTARLVVSDPRLARLATFSVLLIPSLAWHALTYLTHSILAFLAGVACLYFTLKIVREGRTRDYLLLGAVCAAGLLSKYNFVLFAAALLLASLTLAPSRRRLVNGKIGWTLLAFVLLALPHALWMLDHRAVIRDDLLMKVLHTRATEIGHAARSWIGLREFVLNALLTAGLPVLALGIAFRSARDLPNQPDATDGPAFARVLLDRFFVAALVAMVGLILVNGWDRFHERWLMPFAIVLPIRLFAGIDPAKVTAKRARLFAGILMGLAGVYVLVRAIQVLVFLDQTKGLYPLRVDFRAVARSIAAEAGPRPLILTRQREVGGNLILALPGARVCCCFWNLYDLPPSGAPIVIAWNPEIVQGRREVPWSWIERYWSIAPPRHVPAEAIRVVPVAASGPHGRPASVAFTVLK